MFEWESIETVLLDMDGTLLDLHFDNFFWQEYLPECWAHKNGMDLSMAKQSLEPELKRMTGTLSWYCLDFWSDHLDIDIMALKNDLIDMIVTRPRAIDFLEHIGNMQKTVIMVTNAHQKLIDMKLDKTGIGTYFRKIICAHDYGSPKEDLDFWHKLDGEFKINKQTTLLIDDNQAVLNTARQFGIKNLITIAKPDSKAPVREITDYHAIHDFAELM